MYVISFEEKTKRTMGVFLSIDSFITKKLILLNIILSTIMKSKDLVSSGDSENVLSNHLQGLRWFLNL